MAGPKHLWSGDWEQESTQAADERTPPRPRQPEVAAAPEPEAKRKRRPRLTVRQLVICAAAFIVVGVGVALAINGSGGSTKPTRPKAPAAVTQPPPAGSSGGIGLTQPSAPTRVANEPSANWMGMHIVTSPLGTVVSTVAAGSGAQSAGVQPGDVITAIDNDAITSARQIRAAVAKIALGTRIEITINRGSTILTTAATLRNRPTIQP
jgi:membrane-associated protease RseP (regulator of RpoE activity)